jgi:hypothetical protein
MLKSLQILPVLLCLATNLSGVDAKPENITSDCVAENSNSWSLPWSSIKYIPLNREPLLHNEKPTQLHRRLLKFPREISVPVPGCKSTHLLRTRSVAEIDYDGHVFAYLISGIGVYRDQEGHERALGSAKFAMWYDDDGSGRFKKVIWTPTLPPTIPAWVYSKNQPSN